MKHLDNAAVVEFKSQVDRMADFLQAAGYDIKRTHLVEAGARFAGARDWRTLRAGLTDQPAAAPALFTVPNLGGKTVRVYFDVHARSSCGEGPQFCWTDINQAWVNRVWQLRTLCKETNVAEIDDDFDMPDWMDSFGTYRIRSDGLTVTQSQFWFHGQPKHADYRVETDPLDLDALLAHVQATTAKELYLLSDVYAVDALMEELGRDESHADFVSSDTPDCLTPTGNF
jgi:hypothetical protein